MLNRIFSKPPLLSMMYDSIERVLSPARLNEISETRFQGTFNEDVTVYNHHTPQRNLEHISPVQALKN
jgi:hypothetical protein